jgi:hypothetical protein
MSSPWLGKYMGPFLCNTRMSVGGFKSQVQKEQRDAA